jgi:hypothetical protein
MTAVMDGSRKEGDKEPAPPPDGPEGHNSLEDAAEEAARAIAERRDGGTSGFGDIG